MNDPNPELPDYIKPSYPIINKKHVHEDKANMFAKFKEMLSTLLVSISFHEVLELLPKFENFEGINKGDESESGQRTSKHN